MKKIVSLILALAMVLSIGGVSVFAADDVTITLEVAKTPSYNNFVGADDLDAKDEMFEVVVKINNVNYAKTKLADIGISWDPNILTPVTHLGVDATRVISTNSGADYPRVNVDEGTGSYDWGLSKVDAAAGTYLLTAYPDLDTYPTGVDIPAGKTSLEFAKLFFKVKNTGDPKFKVGSTTADVAAVYFGDASGAEVKVLAAFDDTNHITIGETTADKEVTGLSGDAIVVNSVEELPDNITVVLADGSTDTIAVTWDTTAVVDGQGTATAKLPAGYKYQDGVAAITATVKKPAPTDKEVTGLAGDPIVVNSVDELPNPIKVNLVGGETADVTVEWDTTAVVDGEGTATAKLPAGYKYQDGVEAITATVKKPVVSDNKVVESVETQLPTSAADVNELPSQLEVTLDDGTQATVDVVWEYKEGVIVGKIVSEGYEAAPELKIAVDLKDESELPAAIVVGEVTAAPNGGITVPVSVQYNAEYVGDMLDKYGDDAQVALVYFAYKWENNKKVPVINGVSQEGTSFSLAMLKNADVAKDFVINGVDADEVQFSLVLDFNWADVLSGTNYGSPIALGQSAAFPAAE